MTAGVSVQLFTSVALGLFSVLMVAIGIHTSKKAKTIDGFLLGGRKIGAWMSAFAYGTSYFSAVIFIGYAGKNGWDVGLSSIWIGVGNAVLGCFLAWKVLAKKVRQMTHNLEAKTTPEFFESRYSSSAMKIYSAIIIFIFLVPYSAAVYKGLGSMFTTIFPTVSINTCMLIVCVITAVFLVTGGYIATVYTDFVQGLIMLAGTGLMVFLIAYNAKVGGFSTAIVKLKEIDPQLVNVFGGSSWKFLLTNILLTSFGTFGLPQMINKFYAITDEKSAIKKATIVSTLFAGVIGIGAYFVGSMGRLILSNELPKGGYDYVVPNTLVTALGQNSTFSNAVLAVIMVLLLSASMSTLSSIVLTSSSAVTVDLFPAFFPKNDNKHQVLFTRGFCLLFVFLSYIFATMNFAIIVSVMSFSWGALSGSFIGPMLWGLYSKKTTKYGAWAGMLCGISTIGLLTLVKTIAEGFPAAISNAPIYGVTAMAVSLVATGVVSVLTPKLENTLIEKAFQATTDN